MTGKAIFLPELCDRFMDSIEMITSQEREVLVKDKESGKNKVITAKIWNKTVANLTLMALGSSGTNLVARAIHCHWQRY